MFEGDEQQCFRVIATEDGSHTLFHPTYGEAFHSYAGARQEARDLYIVASGFAEAVQQPGSLRVLDVGLGLGYNALETMRTWLDVGKADLTIFSLEKDVEIVEQLLSASGEWLADWDDPTKDLVRAVLPSSDTGYKTRLEKADCSLNWHILVGDACAADLVGPFDFIWHDPFSPKCNGELWTENWFARLRAAANPGCVLMTYSSARVVKDNLEASHWRYEVIPTTTSKRHWLRAKVESN